MFISSLLTDSGFCVNVNRDNDITPYHVSKQHPAYNTLLEAWRNEDVDTFLNNYNYEQAVSNVVVSQSQGQAKFVNGELFYNGERLHNAVEQSIMRMVRHSFDITPALKFVENLMMNPSRRSVEELWKFIERNGLTLTEDGYFLAYKSVSDNYKDKYSGKIDNSIGKEVSVPRNMVDDDFRNHCSHGLHVGGWDYSGPNGWYHNAGDRVLVVKVNPADVVSVPDDHGCTKLRCCKYTVVSEYKTKLNAPVYSGNVNFDGEDYDDDDDWDDDDCWNEVVQPEDLLEGQNYIFVYDKDGVDKTRYVTVESVNLDEGYCLCLLRSPEEHAGEYRRFNFDNIVKID